MVAQSYTYSTLFISSCHQYKQTNKQTITTEGKVLSLMKVGLDSDTKYEEYLLHAWGLVREITKPKVNIKVDAYFCTSQRI